MSKCSQYRLPASVESGNAVKAVAGRITKVVSDHTVGIQEEEGTLVTPNKVSVVNMALLSHLLKKSRFVVAVVLLCKYWKSLILYTKFRRLALETNIVFSLSPSGQSMFRLGPPQPPYQAAPGLHILSVSLLLWKRSFLECSYFHLEKAIYVFRRG